MINKYINRKIIISIRNDSGEIKSQREEMIKKNMHRFLQVTLYSNSAYTGKYNKIKSRHKKYLSLQKKKWKGSKPMEWMEEKVILLEWGEGGGGGGTNRTHLPKNIFNNILKTKQIPDSWHEAKTRTLYKKGDPNDIKNIFTRLLQTRIGRTLDEKPSKRAKQDSEKAVLHQDHLQALSQIIEKSNEYN